MRNLEVHGQTASCKCYDSNPAKLQLCIRKIFEFATSKIEIEGTTVVPVPMFKYLDGKNTRDYVQRVDPVLEVAKAWESICGIYRRGYCV